MFLKSLENLEGLNGFASPGFVQGEKLFVSIKIGGIVWSWKGYVFNVGKSICI